MTVLPIVERELRVASRKTGTYWNRALSAALALTVFGLIFLLGATESSQALGKTLFSVLAVGFLGVSLLTGVIYTADSISEEKREGTLGLLFLTDLKGYDVVFGKLAASSLGAVYATLAILPVLAIPLLLGGVSAEEFGRIVLVLVNTLFLSLAIGVMVSAAMRHALSSMVVTLALVIAVNLTSPLLAVWIAYVTGGEPPEALLVPSVGYACAVAHDALYPTREWSFFASVGITHLLAWLFLLMAEQRTRYVWKTGTEGVRKSWRKRLGDWMQGDRAMQTRWRGTAMEVNPSYWYTGRRWYKGWIVWFGLGVIGLLWLAAYAEWGSDWSGDEGVAVMTILGLHTLLRWWVAGEATTSLGPDKRSGALELVLCSGLGVRDLVHGRLLGLQRQFFGPALAVIFVDLWLLWSVVLDQASGNALIGWVAFIGCLIVVFVLDMVALAWLGLWWGMVCRQASRALLRTAVLIFGLPWALLTGLLVLMIVFRVSLPKPEEILLLGTYGVVSGLVAIMGWHWARQRLLTDFRAAAAGLPIVAESVAETPVHQPDTSQA